MDWYTDEMQGLASYLGEFGLGVTPARRTALPPRPAPKARPVAKTAVRPPAKPPAKKVAKPAVVAAKKAPTKVVKAPPAPKESAADKFAGSPNAMGVAVPSVVEVLRAYGANFPKGQSKYTPAVLAAWQQASKKKGLDPTMFNRGGTVVLVAKNTFDILSSSKPASKSPATKLTPPPKQGIKASAAKPIKAQTPTAAPAKQAATGKVLIDVGTAQDVLLRLRANLGKGGRDGKFGPTTAKAWTAAANKRGIQGNGARFDRASPTAAYVFPATVEALTQAAGVVATTDGQVATAGATPASQAPVKITIGTAQALLLRLGANLGKTGRDGKFGPKTATAWTVLAVQQGVAKALATFERVSGTEARVRAAALTALTKAAGLVPTADGEPAQPVPKTPGVPNEEPEAPSSATPPEAAPPTTSAGEAAVEKIVTASTSSIPISELQGAFMLINQTGQWAGRYPSVRETGTWDAATLEALLNYKGNDKEPRRAVWEPAHARLVDGDSLRVSPAWAVEFQALNTQWQARKAQSAKPDEAAAPPAAPESTPETLLPVLPDAQPERAQVVSRPPAGAIVAEQRAQRQRASQQEVDAEAPIAPPSTVVDGKDNTPLYIGAAVGMGLLILMLRSGASGASGASTHT